MKKHELIEENKRLKQELNDLSKESVEQESDLIRLGIIPDEYVVVLAFGFRYVNWSKIREDREALEAYEAAERGRKLAGVGETTIEVNLDTSGFQEALKKFVEHARRTKPRKPWLDAKPGEVWVIDVNGYPEPLAVIVDDARFETHLAAINKTDPRITAGRRIWPEEAGDEK